MKKGKKGEDDDDEDEEDNDELITDDAHSWGPNFRAKLKKGQKVKGRGFEWKKFGKLLKNLVEENIYETRLDLMGARRDEGEEQEGNGTSRKKGSNQGDEKSIKREKKYRKKMNDIVDYKGVQEMSLGAQTHYLKQQKKWNKIRKLKEAEDVEMNKLEAEGIVFRFGFWPLFTVCGPSRTIKTWRPSRIPLFLTV